MTVLHFTDSLDGFTETFVAYYIEKSGQFSTTHVASFIENQGLKNGKKLLTKRASRTGNFPRYLVEKLLGREEWENEITEYVDRVKPDIVHCHFGSSGLLFKKLDVGGRSGVPYVTSFYGYDAFLYPVKYPKYYEDLKGLFAREKAYFFCEGPHFKEKLVALGAPAPKVFLNPLVVSCKPSVSITETSDNLKFLMIGRFVEKKGFHLALEALGQLKSSLPPFEVNIVGFGEMQSRYEDIIQQYGIEQHVHLLGKLSHDEVKEKLASHHYFLHPSMTAQNGDSEGGAPTIIIEAQAAGLPVIASTHADIPFVMGYDDFLCVEGNLESLKSTILKAIHSNQLDKLISEGQRHVRKQHDLELSDVYMKNLQDIIQQSNQNRLEYAI